MVWEFCPNQEILHNVFFYSTDLAKQRGRTKHWVQPNPRQRSSWFIRCIYGRSISLHSSRKEWVSEAVRSHRDHHGCAQVHNDGDTSSDEHWELCQILTDTAAAFYSWTSSVNTTPACCVIWKMLGNVGSIICSVYRKHYWWRLLQFYFHFQGVYLFITCLQHNGSAA